MDLTLEQPLSSTILEVSLSSTLVEEISAVSKPTLSDQIDLVITSALTALDTFQHQIDAMLSATPLHPYEKLKALYLNSNEKCEMLCDIPAPQDFCLDTTYCCITAISENIQQNSLCQVQALTAQLEKEENSDPDLEGICNAFAELSGNTFVVNKQKMANHLKFLEMARNITIEQIESDPVEVARKVLSQYVKLYQ
jgi:hypothetical protein